MALPSRRVLLVMALVAAALVAGGAGILTAGGQAAQPTSTLPVATTTSTSTTTSTTTTTTIPVYPLTGRPAPDAGALNRPVVSMKIDNVAQARPQAGIDRADLVYEEFTEGVTRLIVIFHSMEAEVAGPVRSVRPADPVIITPLGGVFAFSGGSPAAVEVARTAPVTIVDEGATDVMYRRPGRYAPHNLYTSTAGLLSKGPEGTKPPPKFADFVAPGGTFSPAGAEPVSHLSLVPAPYVTAAYDWDGESGTWKRTTDGVPHFVEGETQIAPTNVIVQFTNYVTFEADATVQYPETVGSGEAWILSGGKLAKGSWSKPSNEEPTKYTDSAGASIALQPGQTWVHLVSPGSSVEPS